MAQEGASLTTIGSAGSFTGSALTPTNPFANASMVVTMANYAGSGAIAVELQASHDGTTWVTVGTAATEGGPAYVNAPGCPGIQLRAVIVSWPASVTGGTVSATVCGV